MTTTPRRVDVGRLRAALLDPDRIGTHFEGCEYTHWGCALTMALDELEAARACIEAIRERHGLVGHYEHIKRALSDYDRVIAAADDGREG